MKPLTVVFFGRSGSGKGTQAKMLLKRFEEDKKSKSLYVETGERFREFIKSEGYVSDLVKKTLDQGGLLPAFLPIWIWADFFVKNLNETDNLILDGLCRRQSEAPIFDSAMKFLNRGKVYIILLDTSREWSKERLVNRGRGDDFDMDDINKRLDWFDKDVIPALEFFRNNDDYFFLEINGERSIEEIHNEIVQKIYL